MSASVSRGENEVLLWVVRAGPLGETVHGDWKVYISQSVWRGVVGELFLGERSSQSQPVRKTEKKLCGGPFREKVFYLWHVELS